MSERLFPLHTLRHERIPVSFIGVLDAIGKGFAKGLGWAVEYAVPVERLVALLFPSIAPEASTLANATALIQTAVLEVEQKYAAAGKQSGSGSQKLGDVLLMVQPVVQQLLQQAGINAQTGYIESLVNAVVAILNVQTAPSTAQPAAPAAA